MKIYTILLMMMLALKTSTTSNAMSCALPFEAQARHDIMRWASQQADQAFWQCADECQKGLSVYNESVENIINLLTTIPLQKIIDNGEIFDLCISIDQLKTEPNSIEERLSSTALLKITVFSARRATNVLLKTLDTIQKAEEYWSSQQRNIVWHLLHSTPNTWKHPKIICAEIASRLTELADRKKYYQEKLGHLVRHLHALNPHDSCQHMQEWMSHTAAIILELVGGTVKVNNAGLTKTAQLVRECASNVEYIKRKYQKKYETTLIPGHFERHWLHYILAAGLGLYFAKNVTNPESIIGATFGLTALKQHFDKSKNQFSRYIIKPVCDVLNIAFSEYKEDNSSKIENFNGPQLDISPLKLNNQEQKKNCQEYLDAHGVKDYGWTEWAVAQGFGQSLKELGIYIEGKALDREAAFIQFMEKNLNVVNTPLQELHLTLKIVCLIPAAFLSFTTFKAGQRVYRWMYHIDYSKMNFLMCSIEKLLIKTVDQMDECTYGQLLHLLYQLKKAASRIVSRSNGDRELFFVDLGELASDDFNARQKEKLIRVMRKRYKFS